MARRDAGPKPARPSRPGTSRAESQAQRNSSTSEGRNTRPGGFSSGKVLRDGTLLAEVVDDNGNPLSGILLRLSNGAEFWEEKAAHELKSIERNLTGEEYDF